MKPSPALLLHVVALLSGFAPASFGAEQTSNDDPIVRAITVAKEVPAIESTEAAATDAGAVARTGAELAAARVAAAEARGNPTVPDVQQGYMIPPPSDDAVINNEGDRKPDEDSSDSALPAEPTLIVEGGVNNVFAAPDAGSDSEAVLAHLRPTLSDDKHLTDLERERARIRLAGDFEASFRNAPVSDVMRTLATHSQMRFITAESERLKEPVTISGTYNILDLLDFVSESYGVAMTFDHRIWRFAKADADALTFRSYTIRYNDRETVEISSPTLGENSSNGSNSSGNQGTNSTGSTGNNSVSSSSEGSFEVNYDPFLDDVRALLTVPQPNRTADSTDMVTGQVNYVQERGELIVLATPFHHELVRDYLDRVDKPIDQIKFAAYFVETSRDPKRELGLDWDITASTTTSGENSSDLNDWVVPRAAILTNYQMANVLKFTASDAESAVVQNPTVVGMPNRKTVLDATRQIPVAQSTFNAGGSVSPSSSTSLQYLDVGTIVNMFPVVREMEDGSKRIRMHVSLVVSSVIGQTEISGNPAPLTARRRFEFSVEINAGETIAIGGLVSSSSTRASNKVPFFGDVPVLGRLFRSDSDEVSRSNMVVYITPTLLGSAAAARISDLPRVWPEDTAFDRPIFSKATASLGRLKAALVGFDRELSSLETFAEQRRDPATIRKRLDGLSTELDDMEAFTRELRRDGVEIDPTLRSEIDSLSAQASRLGRSIRFAARI